MKRKHFLILFLVLALWACKSDEERLRERVEKYWQLRLSGNLTEAYHYEYPLLRKQMDVNTYISSRHNPLARYKEARIVKITFPRKDVAEVEMSFTVEVLLSGAKRPFETHFTRRERWVKIDGEWFHVPAK